MLKAGSYGKGRLFPTERGTPQGAVISPLLSNILLTPFDQEMRRKGYQLTRYADDWVVTCKSAEEARAPMAAALRILKRTGGGTASAEDADCARPARLRISRVQDQTRESSYSLPQIRSAALQGPGRCMRTRARNRSSRFMDQVRRLTKRRVPLSTKELIDELNPVLRGWGHYYKRAHVRRLFNRLDCWIVRRIWSHRYKRWRNSGWKQLPERRCMASTGLSTWSD